MKKKPSHHRQRPGAELPVVSEFNRSAEEMNTAVPKKKTPWSKQFFIGAAVSGGWITLQIATGENLSKYHPGHIDRLDHLVWYFLPLFFCAAGFGFLAYERRVKKEADPNRQRTTRGM